MEFIIVTGMSGAGKSRAIAAMEDIGFYCADNIPPQLIPQFYELCLKKENERNRVAVVTDTRGGEMFGCFFNSIDKLKEKGYEYKIFFMDANDEIIIRRYKETRRKHPLAFTPDITIEQAVNRERDILTTIKEISDYTIDTSTLSAIQLREKVIELFLSTPNNSMIIKCESFGYKYGLPRDADLVFDVRCFPNPFYIPELKHQTGLDKEVKDYVLQKEETREFINKFIPLIDYLVPLYHKEGKSQLVIAVGCTGGKHRSVCLTQLLYEHFMLNGYISITQHRDIHR